MRLQDYLSIGYLYLLVIGILRDVIFYRILGINILEYTSITDILLSPLTYIVSQPLSLIPFAFILLLMTNKRMYNLLNRTASKKRKDKAIVDYENLSRERKVTLLAFMIGALLAGTAVGAGMKTRSLISNKTLNPKDKITMMDNKDVHGRIIGQNSIYVFFVPAGEDQIKIYPITNVIKVIERG